MATAQQVVDLHDEFPTLTATEIAHRLKCSDGYVRATAQRRGIDLPKGKHGKPPATTVEVVHGG